MAKRQMRLTEKPKMRATDVTNSAEKTRNYPGDLLTALRQGIENDIDEKTLAAGLTEDDVKTLVKEWVTADEAYEALMAKAKQEYGWKIELIKAVLKVYGRETGWRKGQVKVGDANYEAAISQSSSTDISSLKVITLLLELYKGRPKEERDKAIEAIASVKVGEAKKFIGEDLLKRKAGMVINVEPVGSIKLKRLKD